jgi:hypothetical protein
VLACATSRAVLQRSMHLAGHCAAQVQSVSAKPTRGNLKISNKKAARPDLADTSRFIPRCAACQKSLSLAQGRLVAFIARWAQFADLSRIERVLGKVTSTEHSRLPPMFAL